MTSTILVAQLNERWRVVDDGSQWVLQRLDGEVWRVRTRCRARPSLERAVRLYAGPVDPAALAILAALPGHIDWGEPKPARREQPKVPGSSTSLSHHRRLQK